MTTPSIAALIFGQDIEPSPCAACAGIGLLCIEPGEDPLLCSACGGSGMSNALASEPGADLRQVWLRLDLDDGPSPQADLDDDDFLIVDPNILARFRQPMTGAELDAIAAEFAQALVAGMDAFERECGRSG